MTYLVWDGSSLFEKDGSLVKVGEDECCCITTTGSTASTSGSTDSDSGDSDSTSDSGSTDSASISSSTSGSGGSAECVVDSDCCVCVYEIEKEQCALDSCPDGWIDTGFFCTYTSEHYVNCDSNTRCPPGPIDDLGEIECCEGWHDVSEGGYSGACRFYTEESGVCCDGECKEDCCEYREMPEEVNFCEDQSCEWDWDGSSWNKDFDGCEGDCVCPEPSGPGYNIGDTAETECDDGSGCEADLQIELEDGTIYCCPEGCPPDQDYDPSTYSGDGPCCCQNPPDCICYCECDGSFPCTEAGGGGQAACEDIGPFCSFQPESSPGADDCGCNCDHIPDEFASVDDDCGTENADVDAICGPGSECVGGSWDFYCVDQND